MLKKLLFFLLLIFISFLIFQLFFNGSKNYSEKFTVGIYDDEKTIIDNLKNKNFIGSKQIFKIVFLLYGKPKIKPGGYKIEPKANILKIISILKKEPHFKWVILKEGLRKEEIANIISKELNWHNDQKENFLNAYKKIGADYEEGVYFPDTYLLPSYENGEQIAQRLINNFNEKTSDLLKEAARQNIKWTTLLKIASLIQRESYNEDDALIVSGVIWNRLLKNMKLDIDATIQYIKAPDKNNNYWGPIYSQDKKIDSPYNTYLYKGLPKTPICNPGILAIKAALYPANTDCLFYFHDQNKKIYCSKTYDEHKIKIEKILRSEK